MDNKVLEGELLPIDEDEDFDEDAEDEIPDAEFSDVSTEDE